MIGLANTDSLFLEPHVLQGGLRECEHNILQADGMSEKLERLNRELNQNRRERIALVNNLILSPENSEIKRDIYIKTLDTEKLIEERRRTMSKIAMHINCASATIACLLREAVLTNRKEIITKCSLPLSRLDNLVGKLRISQISGLQPEIFTEVLLLLDNRENYNQFRTLKFRINKLRNNML